MQATLINEELQDNGVTDQNYRKIFPLIYSELENIANMQIAAENRDLTLNSSDLVHDLFIKWHTQDNVDCNNKKHLIRLASIAMRQVLIDHARRTMTEKRGGDRSRIELDEQRLLQEEADAGEFTELDNACCELKTINQRLYDIIKLKYYCGLSISQVADTLDISVSTVDRGWKEAKNWLYHRLQ